MSQRKNRQISHRVNSAILGKLFIIDMLVLLPWEKVLSDYAYERAVALRLIMQLNEAEKEEFKKEVQKQLGLQPGQDCDKICGSLSDQQFQDLVEWVKKTIRDRKRRIIEPMYA